MAVKLGPDGKVIEQQTQKTPSFEDALRQDGRTGTGRPPTDQPPAGGGAEQSDYEAKTILIRAARGRLPAGSGTEWSDYEARTVVAKSQEADAPPADGSADTHTRVYRPGAARGSAPAREQPPVPVEAPVPERPALADPMDDPPVGWLVVIRGPGRGNVVTIGNGMNAIGRDRTERVCLDFGDALISRHSHAVVTYDPKGRKFYIQHGGGRNLTYMGDAPVLVPTELPGFSTIALGETVLLFVPLCGERFDWEDDEQ